MKSSHIFEADVRARSLQAGLRFRSTEVLRNMPDLRTSPLSLFANVLSSEVGAVGLASCIGEIVVLLLMRCAKRGLPMVWLVSTVLFATNHSFTLLFKQTNVQPACGSYLRIARSMLRA